MRLGSKKKVASCDPLITIYPLKKLTGTRNVLLDSLEDALLETPKRNATKSACRDLKFGTLLPVGPQTRTLMSKY